MRPPLGDRGSATLRLAGARSTALPVKPGRYFFRFGTSQVRRCRVLLGESRGKRAVFPAARAAQERPHLDGPARDRVRLAEWKDTGERTYTLLSRALLP
ncbi:hypothetical protein MTO96_005815 [Rhipicephalus appendiculatus]